MWRLSYTPGIVLLFVLVIHNLIYVRAISDGASVSVCHSELPENQKVEAFSWTGLPSVIDETACNGAPEVTIAVMGATGSGKTSFVNLASGSNLGVGKGLHSCTSVVQIARPFELGGRCVTLIDTPGFDDTTKSDSEVLRMISAFLATAYENGKKLAGVVYIHRISDFKMGGISTRNFNMFRELCGESTLKNVIIVTNMWGEVSQDVGEAREKELFTNDLFFKPVLEKGALMLRHDNTPESAHSILERLVQNQPLSLQIQRELVDEKKDISETAAGEQLNKELILQIRKHEDEKMMMEKEMKEALNKKNEEAKRQVEIKTKKLQDELERLTAQHNEERRRLEFEILVQKLVNEGRLKFINF